jgi:hypothetical protein
MKPPITQRRFATSWGELHYVCKKIRFWLYGRKQKSRAERFRERLQRVLNDLPANDRAIIREEALALLHELKEELDQAIAHREREIQLMEQLQQEAQSAKYQDSTREYMLQDRDGAALEERHAILQALKNELRPQRGTMGTKAARKVS